MNFKTAWLLTYAVEGIFFLIVAVGWMFFLSDYLSVFWILLPVIILNRCLQPIRNQHCRCPHCHQTLLGVGDEGDAVFCKTCEQCGGSLRGQRRR